MDIPTNKQLLLDGSRPEDDGSVLFDSEAQLDRHDLTVDSDRQELCVTWRHAGWASHRRTVYDAITRCSGSQSRLERYRNCGAGAWVAHAEGDPTRVRLLASYCHDRFCKPCAAAKSRRLADALVQHVAGRRIRLITFTLRSSTDPLKDQLRRLQKCFRKLRQHQWWNTKVTGGLATIEITRCELTGKWHPHLHVIATGKYIDWHMLKDHWLRCTGDSNVVDVRDAGGIEATCRYVAKYVGKGVPASIMRNEDLACEVVAAFTGVRGYTCFGNWHGFQVTRPTDNTTWIKIESLEAVIIRAERGSQAAKTLLELLKPANFANKSTSPNTPNDRPP